MVLHDDMGKGNTSNIQMKMKNLLSRSTYGVVRNTTQKLSVE
jgi:hypothetical protein